MTLGFQVFLKFMLTIDFQFSWRVEEEKVLWVPIM